MEILENQSTEKEETSESRATSLQEGEQAEQDASNEQAEQDTAEEQTEQDASEEQDIPTPSDLVKADGIHGAKKKTTWFKNIFGLIFNQITLTLAVVLLVAWLVLGFIITLGKSDFRWYCNDIGSAISLNDSADEEARGVALAKFFSRTTFTPLGGTNLTIEQGAGMAAVIMSRSQGIAGELNSSIGLQAAAVDNDYFEDTFGFNGLTGNSIGLGQWDGAERDKFIQFAIENNQEWTSASIQLEYIELQLNSDLGLALCPGGPEVCPFMKPGQSADYYAGIFNGVFPDSGRSTGQAYSAYTGSIQLGAIESFEQEKLQRTCTTRGGGGGATGDFAWPVDAVGNITSGFGPRGCVGGGSGTACLPHLGVDIGGGGNIYAADGGVIVQKQTSSAHICAGNASYGNMILIDHGNGLQTRYAHLGSFASGIELGVNVGKGEVLGQMGSTGCSFGVHLHFEVRENGSVMDPANYLP